MKGRKGHEPYDPRRGTVHKEMGEEYAEGERVYSRDELRSMPQRDNLTPRQLIFVEAYLRLKRSYDAAIEAGYAESTAKAIGRHLLDETYYPLVARAVKEGLKKQMQETIMDGAAILRYIHTVMTFCPADWFAPAGDNGWVIDLDEYRVLPAEIRMIIEHMEMRNIELPDGTKTSSMWVKFVSKTTAMQLAAKHQLGEKNNDTTVVQQIDWTTLFGRQPLRKLQVTVEATSVEDPVEAKILQLEAQTVPPSTPVTHEAEVHGAVDPQSERKVPVRKVSKAKRSNPGGSAQRSGATGPS